MFRKYSKIDKIDPQCLVEIVSDAAIAMDGHANGKLVPLVIVDSSDRADLDELIRVHEFLPPGDVDVTWCKLFESDNQISLQLEFRSPIESIAIIQFEDAQHCTLVDQIVRTGLFYFQTGRKGDRFITTQDRPRIIVEVPDTGFKPIWEKMFRKLVFKRLRSEGMGRKEAKQATTKFIADFREFGRFQFS